MSISESITVVKRNEIWVTNMPLEPGEGFCLPSPLQTPWAENVGEKVLKRYKGILLPNDIGMVIEKSKTTIVKVD